METLLIVDDDLSLLETLHMHFEDVERNGEPAYHVLTATTAAEALEQAHKHSPALVILDMRLPDRSGLEIVGALKECSDAQILIVTAHHDMETTIRAMKAGAFDYIHKPFPEPAALDLVVERALSVRRLSRRAAAVSVDAGPLRLGDIVGTSPPMQKLVKEIGRISSAQRATVLIHGESGTGKELVARVIHNYSYDDDRPFIGINCSAIVDTLLESELFGHERGAFTGANQTKPGKFEIAEDGTVFLDEIGDMSLPLQGKLLRVLQEREFERVGGVKRIGLRARIITATHRDLTEEVRIGRFREDLYQRLKVVTVELPPLRSRKEDIPALVQYLLESINEKVQKRVTRVAPEVLERLVQLDWPGNVRELANVIERAVVLSTGDALLPEHLPVPEPKAAERDGSSASGLAVEELTLEGFPSLEEMERRHVLRALELTRGHKGRTCQLLGISRPTLERKLQKYRPQPS